MNPIKVFTTFSGYDSQCLAFKYANIPFELIGWSDIDKDAIMAHNLLFPKYKDKNYGDITKINWNDVPDFDFLTYSSPCQDISYAGMRRGLTQGTNTRSSLLWNVEDAIRIKKPKYLLMENVKGILSSTFINDFNKWLDILKSYGYDSYYGVLCAKDFGIPQNRERVFVFSKLSSTDTQFEMPEPIPLTIKLSDLLEDVSDDCKEWITRFDTPIINTNPLTILFKGKPFVDYDTTYINTSKTFIRGGMHNISRTLKALCHDVGVCINGRLRYLTSKEYMRLMGVKDEDYDKLVQGGMTDFKIKKVAGNSIVTNCLIAIYENAFIGKTYLHNTKLW